MTLIHALQNPQLYPHPVNSIAVIETHISWVLLTGDYAYKIKKPVNFGFLDFSSLAKRRFYCQEELRLNRRLAANLYLDVVNIYGTEDAPNFLGEGDIIEYAVKMHQFPQSAQLDRLLAVQALTCAHIDELATRIANFHQCIERAPMTVVYGEFDEIIKPVQDNFRHIRQCIKDKDVLPLLQKLEQWSTRTGQALKVVMAQRKQGGFVRECHGDMHLRNIAWFDGNIVIFDCIEFNRSFYWIDVMSEIAFLIMDLEDRQQTRLAQRCLNHYLELTGDYAGLELLRYYKVYRAMVRAKVDALRANQEHTDSEAHKKILQNLKTYLQLAKNYTVILSPCLIITHGLSGSGKTTWTQSLLEVLPAIRIRSDVERKRLFNVSVTEKGETVVGQGIYTNQASEQTYQQLLKFSRQLLQSGYSVIVDAANLRATQRQNFMALAKQLGVKIWILTFKASPNTLRKRVAIRHRQNQDTSDATLAVLEHQMDDFVPLTSAEMVFTIEINTETDNQDAMLHTVLQQLQPS